MSVSYPIADNEELKTIVWDVPKAEVSPSGSPGYSLLGHSD
jgi:hypothetical protein